MPDSVYEILIKFGLDDAKAREAAAQLEGIKTETESASPAAAKMGEEFDRAMDKSANSARSMAQAFRVLGHEFPLLGAIGRLAMNPVVAGASLALVAVRALREQIKATADLLEPSEWQGRAAAIRAGKDAFDAARIAANLYWADLGRAASGVEALKDKTDDLVASIHKEAAAAEAVREANKKLALSRAADETEKAAIEHRFAGMESQAKTLEENRVLNALLRERAALLDHVAEKERTLPALQTQAAAAAADLTKVAAEREIHTKNLAAAEAKIADYDKEVESRSKFGMRSAIYDKLTDAGVASSRQTEIATADKLRRTIAEIDAKNVARQTEDKKAVADAAATEAEVKAGRAGISGLDAKIATEFADTQRNKATRTQVSVIEAAALSQSPMAPTLLDAAAGADAIRGGGRATPDQSRAINEASKLEGLRGNSTEAILQYLAKINDSEAQFVRALAALRLDLDRRINELGGQLRTQNRTGQ